MEAASTSVYVRMDKGGAYTLVYIMNFYSASREKALVLFATMWVDPEVIILTGISQIEKYKYCAYHLHMESEKPGE